jgi:PAS domain S-box-containing protein
MVPENTDTAVGPLVFQHLPKYALFLLNNKLDDFSAGQLHLIREMDVPVFKYFAGIPEQELTERYKGRVSSFLELIAANRAEDYISISLNRWTADQLPLISREKVIAEDITLISFIRRKMFRDYLHYYTSEPLLLTSIMQEVDVFTTETDTQAFKILLSIQQELYRQTKEIAQLGNWVWDLKEEKITWSDEIFRMYELPPQQNITYNLASFNHPDDVAMITTQMRTSRETLQPHDFYYRIIPLSGNEKVLHAKGRVLVNEKGEAYRMFGTVQDVTAQKRLEKDVLEKQFLIQKITDITPSLIAAYNINTGKYLFINKAIQAMLGYTQEDVLEGGAAFFVALVHPDDLQDLMKKNAKALAEANMITDNSHEPVTEFRYRLKHKNGGYRWMQTYGTIFNRNRLNQVEEVINVSIDVTEQINNAQEIKAKHEELEEKNKELEFKNRELEAFSYIASHDLQEPLRKIKFYSDQVKTKEDSSGNYFERIINETTRMQQLISGLLQYSQMGREEKAFERADLNEIVKSVEADLFEELSAKQAVLIIEPLPVINGLPLQLHQLFINLVSNSLKYSRNGVVPQIKIAYALVEAPGILPGFGNVHKISLSDNGIGFDEQYAVYIFELFRRLHAKTAYPGTGVGLTICKKIVENHKGVIKAEGVPGKGAAFYIYLPAEGVDRSKADGGMDV